MFTPSVLTILCLNLFRRLGYVVGAGGMGQALVFLPLRLRRERAMDRFGKPIEDLVAALPMLVLVSAVQGIALGAEPEAGEISRMAGLTDAVKDARRARPGQAARRGLSRPLRGAGPVPARRSGRGAGCRCRRRPAGCP